MIDLGDTVLLPEGIVAKVCGWQKMLGGNTEWCLRWWADGSPTEIWMTKEEIDAWSDMAVV